MPGTSTPIHRRVFVRDGSLYLLAAAATPRLLGAEPVKRQVRVGLLTDLHHADKPVNGTRHYRDTLAKLGEAAQKFAEERPDFVVELGDFIDAADAVETELAYLRQVNDVFSRVSPMRHYVLGNHCVDLLNKDEFLSGVGQKESFYSFDAGGAHFVVLDSCFTGEGKPYGRKNSHWTDANIPGDQRDWLAADLKNTNNPVVVFAHQRLDEARQHAVKNAAEVRKILENSGKVLAVFQGHSHKNDHQEISGIHYCTLVAMVEGAGPDNNGYSLLDVLADGTLRLSGFRTQANYHWK